jgi:hypothetical protein
MSGQSMTAKERVYASLRREPVDRVPVSMWFHPETRDMLASLLEIPATHVDAADEIVGGLAEDGFAVGLARMTQHDAEDMGPAALPVGRKCPSGKRA